MDGLTLEIQANEPDVDGQTWILRFKFKVDTHPDNFQNWRDLFQ